MGKKKSKSQKNGFYYFMLHVQGETKGARTISLREASEIAGERWQKMSAQEKAPFEKKAREERQMEKSEKYTSQGVPFSVLDAQKQAEKLDTDKKNFEINSTIVCAVNNNAIDELDFYIIDVNIFVETLKKRFIPAEIAISKFNLKDGVHNTFHSLIDPGEIPTGYNFEAKSYTNESHQLPLPPEAYGESNMSVLFSKIMNFIMEGRSSMPPLYTIQKHIHHTKGFLLQLCEDLEIDNSEIRVYNIAEAFLILRNVCSKYGIHGTPVYLNLAMAEMEIEKDVYDYYKYLACDYHEKTDVIHMCSLSRVKRWGFIIADNCCKDLEINMTLGKHLPIQAALPNVIYATNHQSISTSSFTNSYPLNISKNKPVKTHQNNIKENENAVEDIVISKMNSISTNEKRIIHSANSQFLPEKNLSNGQPKNESIASSSVARLPKYETKITAAKLFEIDTESNISEPNSWTTVTSKKNFIGIGRGRGLLMKKK